jgi:hypothetical protein
MKLVKDLKGHLHLKVNARPKKKIGAALTLTMVFCMALTNTVLASDGSANTIDESVFTTIVNGAKAVLGLFSIFPINIFLAVSIMGVAVGIVRKVKGA